MVELTVVFLVNSLIATTTKSKLRLKYFVQLKYCVTFLCSWFHPNLSKVQAEQMLKTARLDGAYIVRASDQANNYAISFL